MAALAERAEGGAGKLGMLDGDGDDLDLAILDKAIDHALRRRTLATFDDQRRLHEAYGREQARCGGINHSGEPSALWLVEQDGDDRGGVDHHQRGTPYSS